MPFYRGIKDYKDPAEVNWIANRLLNLRSDLYAKIGSDRDPKAIIIGSRNIRAFDGGRSRRNWKRQNTVTLNPEKRVESVA